MSAAPTDATAESRQRSHQDTDAPAVTSETSRRLSVAVFVDLFLEPAAGGHVKSWQQIARFAAGHPSLDLTVYFLGRAESTTVLADNVRLLTLPPALGTDRFSFLREMPGQTDLAPFRPGLRRRLQAHDVLHTTDAYFAFARSALRFARRAGRALVSSVHTATPAYTAVYSRQVIRQLFGQNVVARLLLDRWRCDSRLEAWMERRLERYLQRCDWALAPAEDAQSFSQAGLAGRVSVLRRGIDKETFHPWRRDRVRLEQAYGIPADCPVLLFAGRVDAGKNVMTVAHAARTLLDAGTALHIIFAGEGRDRSQIWEVLGRRATLPGVVMQDDLAWFYASSDLFVFPSQIEVLPNVVLEAKAAGLVPVVAAAGGSARLIAQDGEDGVLVRSAEPADWAAAIRPLLADPQRRAAMARSARHFIETQWPSWRDVLEEDLWPVWTRVARERGRWP